VNGGKELLTSSGDSTCFLWDIERQEIMQKFEDHTGDVMSISISPENEKIFASGSCDTCVKVWDMREKSNHSHTFGGDGDGDDDVAYGHESDINSIDFMGNGYSIASGSDDSTCKVRESTRGGERAGQRGGGGADEGAGQRGG
jgi:guanine nucleotide-binding protein G(I)/G(S)/G(T) subunit beta-1